MRDSLVSVLISIHHRITQRAATVTNRADGYGRKVSENWVLILEDEHFSGSVSESDASWLVKLSDNSFVIEDNWTPMDKVYSVR